MITVQLRFYEELNDFLPEKWKKVQFQRQSILPTTVKDIIESCGVPHTEIDLILVNGESVTFDTLIRNGDNISIYPVFESLDISSVTQLLERPLRRLRFQADIPLGKLVRTLRLLGFDVVHSDRIGGLDLVQSAVNAERVLLTRSRQLLMQKVIRYGYCVRHNRPEDQVIEVLRRFDLRTSMKPFTRCMVCNSILEPVDKKEIWDRLETLTRQYYDDFTTCSGCMRLYWPGSHFIRLRDYVDKIVDMLDQEVSLPVHPGSPQLSSDEG